MSELREQLVDRVAAALHRGGWASEDDAVAHARVAIDALNLTELKAAEAYEAHIKDLEGAIRSAMDELVAAVDMLPLGRDDCHDAACAIDRVFNDLREQVIA